MTTRILYAVTLLLAFLLGAWLERGGQLDWLWQ